MTFMSDNYGFTHVGRLYCNLLKIKIGETVTQFVNCEGFMTVVVF